MRSELDAAILEPGPLVIGSIADRDAKDAERVLEVRHWDDRLFSFRLTRPASLRFRSGEFVMIGLPDETERPIMRAYSIASPIWDDTLEFYSIKVPDGPLTSRLQKIQPGDQVILRPKPVGTLVLDALKPGARLWMLCTGTGVAPFASLMRDPETYEKFEEILLIQTCRKVSELAYGDHLAASLADDPLVGEEANRFRRLATTTREPSAHRGRITDLIATERLQETLDVGPLDPAQDRVMVCGSLAFNKDIKALLTEKGFEEGSNACPGDFVVEKAFVG
jgi:ferredoxin--NADP+ reductase